MRVVIIGCGRVGAALASQLDADGHEVVVVDITTESFRRLEAGFRGQALRGDGTDAAVLERAGARGADWFFALTNGDNRNVLAAQVAAQDFGIGQVVCKINDPVRAATYATLGVNTINRTDMMVDSIGRFMGRPPMPGAADVNVAVRRRAPLPATSPGSATATAATAAVGGPAQGGPVGPGEAAPSTPVPPGSGGEGG